MSPTGCYIFVLFLTEIEGQVLVFFIFYFLGALKVVTLPSVVLTCLHLPVYCSPHFPFVSLTYTHQDDQTLGFPAAVTKTSNES